MKEKLLVVPKDVLRQIFAKALKDYAIKNGFDPNKEIKNTSWKIVCKNKQVKLLGTENDSQTENQG
jgi:hypothetical protein